MSKLLVLVLTLLISVAISTALVMNLPGHFYHDEIKVHGVPKSSSWTTSWEYPNQNFADVLARNFWATMRLQGLAFVFVVLLSLALSFIALQWKFLQNTLQSVLFLFTSAPALLWIPLLIYFFSLKLEIFPIRFEPTLSGWVLPLLALIIRPLGLSTQLLLSELKKSESQPYFIVARSKGLSYFKARLRHGLKNSLIPFSTQLGAFFVQSLMGSILVESLFSYPGMGLLFVESLKVRDLPVVLFLTIIFTVILVIVHTLVEILHQYLEPRIRHTV